jgi:hypothetical protein
MNFSVLCRESPAQWNTAMRATCVALLQGPSLRSRLCCPGPSSLNRPHPPHSRAHRNFAARRFICGAFAVRERLGDPRAVSAYEPRSLVLYQAVPLVSNNLEGSHFHSARYARALAQNWLSRLLALEVAPTGRATADRRGTAQFDPADERRKSALGHATYPLRTAQARV